ncbi:hypothetical protein B0H13DRAFT_2549611 [Mycena leptocephala]|nr:hypothetical protein B0H13DRAFT_2549611 [Mycena leptocephala]
MAGSLSPSILDHIGSFKEALHKIYTFVEAQQDGNKIKQFLRQSEMNVLLRNCRAGLDHAIAASIISEMKKYTEKIHEELLELISTLSDSDGTFSDRSSSIYHEGNGSQNSSNSFSMLPSKPKIFHGREYELAKIMNILYQESPRIAILGGGMGKTSLARAVLHHPDICTKYKHRFFVSAESTTNNIELAALIGLHIGLEAQHDLTRPVVNHFSGKQSSLLILDNLETPWEPIQSRPGIEEFLSLLTDVPHLALIITMRGAERPAKVRWTHPFLLPLQPLTDDAAQQIFIDITDNSHNPEEMNQLLQFTDNMPLAVDLMAHLVDYEGFSNVLARWETEKTSLHSADIELVQSNLSIQNILQCKAALLATSLAYQDDKKRLRSLLLIREHIQRFSSPSQILIQHIGKYFHSILNLYQKYNGEQLAGIVTQITLNMGNLHQILSRQLHAGYPDLPDAIRCTLSLNSFSRLTMSCHTTLMDSIPTIFLRHGDHHLEAYFLTEKLCSHIMNPITDPEVLIAKLMSLFQHFNDPILECKFLNAVAVHYNRYHSDPSQAMEFLEKALAVAKFNGEANEECTALASIAQIKLDTGAYLPAQIYAHKAQKLAELSGNLYQGARALFVRAVCSMYFGNYQDSIIQLQRAREILGICGMSGGDIDYAITTIQAEVHLRKSEYAEARSIHTKIVKNSSVDVRSHIYAPLNIAIIDVIIGAAEQERERHLSSKLFQKCLRLSLEKDKQIMSYCLERLANVSQWSGTEFNWKSSWPVVYLVFSQKSKDKLALHKALLCLGDVYVFDQDEGTAHSLFTVALEGFTFMDVHCSRAQCMQRLGDLANKGGDFAKAIEFWKAARPLFERSLQATYVAQIDTRLAAVEKAQQKALAHIAHSY